MKNSLKGPIRAVLFGVGVTGRELIARLPERGVELTGVFARSSHIGEDSGLVAGCAANGVKVSPSDDASIRAVLSETKPDLAIICTTDDLPTLMPLIKPCVECGVNVLSSSGLLYYPYGIYPEGSAELDELAKANGVTVFASGIQDVFFTSLVTVLTGACYSIKSVTLTDLATIDRFYFWPVFGIGKTKEEYEEYLKAHPVDEAHAYSHLAIAMNATVAALGLTAVAQHDELEILYTDEDTYNAYRDLHIKKGCVIGKNETTAIETAEGITFRCEFISKMAEEHKGETGNLNRIVVEGEPNLDLVTTDKHGEMTTTASMLNRIPDVLNAGPGLKTVADLSMPYLKVKPLGDYLEA